MKKQNVNKIIYYSIATAIGWTIILATLLTSNILETNKQVIKQATIQTRTFFTEFLVTRFWNAMHGGIYVPITEETQPNPYLKDPLRDLTTLEGLKLTKINPAYMTRQIADISAKNGIFRIHITSLDPISAENKPDQWEIKALRSFLDGPPEIYEIIESDQGGKMFKYMAPLIFDEYCLDCHAQYNAAKGEVSGGISVTISADPLISSRNKQIRMLAIVFSCIWLIGLTGIIFVFTRLRQDEKKREGLIFELEDALAEVKQLSGLLPICCSCKSIRDDKGYWQTIEKYISSHSEAQFTHGLCKKCAHKLYPEIMQKKAQDKNTQREDGEKE